MAKQANDALPHGEPSPVLPPTDGGQAQDIVLVIDRQQKAAEAVSSVYEDGYVHTVPADSEHQNRFLQIGHNSDALDIIRTFFTNLSNQIGNPTRFGLLQLSTRDFVENIRAIRDLSHGRETPEARALLAKSELKLNTPSIHNLKNNKEMAKQEPAPTGAPETGTQKAPRYNESMIDWSQLEECGLSKEALRRRGELENMLHGRKTSQLIPIQLHLPGIAVIRTDARLSFQNSPDGVVLGVHGVRREPELERPYFGHVFSPEDKKNLRESGNMGRTVDLRFGAEDFLSLVSIDRLTNEIVSMWADSLYVPDEIYKVKLTNDEKQSLRAGKAVYLEGMISKAGKEFDAHVQFNADRRGVEFIFPRNNLQHITMLGGVELSPRQQEDYSVGRTIFVEGMKSKNGEETYDRFVQRNGETGQPQYFKYNPDVPGEILVPKTLYGVELSAEERAELRQGKPVWFDGMTARNGEEFSGFVRFDTATGDHRTARTLEGLDEVRQFRIPDEVYGRSLSATERAQLQDGKAVHLVGLKGHDGKEFDSWAKVNARSGHLDYFAHNPDQKREVAQKTTTTPQQQKPGEKSDAPKKSKGQKM